MSYSIFQQTPIQDDVRKFVQLLNAHLQPLSPPEFQFQLTVEQMDDPATKLFLVRDEAGQAVGMGALKLHGMVQGECLAEIKRMFTLPEVRGQRLGRMIAERIEVEARNAGVTLLKLETGSTESMPEAHRLYRNCGFVPCAAFLDYPESPFSAFYEKRLAAARTKQ